VLVTFFQDLQKKLKKKTSKANEIFNTCDIFFNDNPISSGCSSFDPLRMTYMNLHKRWSGLLARSDERQKELERLWTDWSAFNRDYDKLQSWISEQSLILKGMDVQASRVSYESLESIENDLEDMRRRQEENLSELDALNDVYCELAREYRLDASDDLKNKFIQANNDWEDLSHELEATLKRIRHSRQLYLNFRALRDKEINFLRQTDARLTELEFSSDVDWREKVDGLRQLRRAMGAREAQLEKVGEASMHLVQRSELKDAEHVEDLTREFFSLQTDVTERLERLLEAARPPPETTSEEEERPETEDLPPISVNSSIQVDTLKFESDRSTQADTLLLAAGGSAPDSGVSMTASWPTPEHMTRGATPVSSSQSPAQKIPEEQEEIPVDEYLAKLSEEASGMEDNYEQLVSDLERHLGEFHSNGDLLEDALAKNEAVATTVASSDQDLVSHNSRQKHWALNKYCQTISRGGKQKCSRGVHTRGLWETGFRTNAYVVHAGMKATVCDPNIAISAAAPPSVLIDMLYLRVTIHSLRKHSAPPPPTFLLSLLSERASFSPCSGKQTPPPP
jgi:hypothetical protein